MEATTPEVSRKFPLKNGGKKGRSFPIGVWVTFSGGELLNFEKKKKKTIPYMHIIYTKAFIKPLFLVGGGTLGGVC